MPRLSALMKEGDAATLVPTFPCVTWPAQANMLTGAKPSTHGIVANGLYDRESHQVNMWTLGNAAIGAPQIWDVLREHRPEATSAAWFPMLAKECGADYACMPAPIHNEDGSESLWCYSKPENFYEELYTGLGHFPLQHFWGPLAGIQSSQWIVDSAMKCASQFAPDFFYIYLPHLDYAAQKHGPNSEQATAAVGELDEQIGRLFDGFAEAYKGKDVLWIAASEYAIMPVDHVVYPNRVLREDGLLRVKTVDGAEIIDFEASYAFALVDHQFSHVFVKDSDPDTVNEVSRIFRNLKGVQEVLAGPGLHRFGVDHPNSGDVVVISEPNSWQAYYYWNDDHMAPAFARTVDIHNKPGYDPVELHFDPATKSIPLDASLVKGSHGAPATQPAQQGVVVTSQPSVLPGRNTTDRDLFNFVLRHLGIKVAKSSPAPADGESE